MLTGVPFVGGIGISAGECMLSSIGNDLTNHMFYFPAIGSGCTSDLAPVRMGARAETLTLLVFSCRL